MPVLPRVRALVLLAALVLAACGSAPADSSATARAGSPGSPCGPVEQPPLQAGSHLIGDVEPPVPYSSTPPTSGWHASGAMEVGIADSSDPLTEPEQVAVLEAGGAVITYRDLPASDVAAVEELVRSAYPGRVAVTPYANLAPGQAALTAWGTLQRCDGLDLELVEAFLAEHVEEEVSPGHEH